MASLYERDNWFVGSASDKRGRSLGDAGGFFTVSYPVNRRDQNSVAVAAHQMMIARFSLAWKDVLGDTIFDHRLSYCLHFFTATVVPLPSWEVISNSSINRRTPGNPSPRLPEVEKPSRRACGMSWIPGPLSDAMIKTPWRLKAWTIFRVISPLRA